MAMAAPQAVRAAPQAVRAGPSRRLREGPRIRGAGGPQAVRGGGRAVGAPVLPQGSRRRVCPRPGTAGAGSQPGHATAVLQITCGEAVAGR